MVERVDSHDNRDASVRETVLDGYYSSGDHECFCFDKWDGPDVYYEAFPDDVDAEIAAANANRVYPNDLLPCNGYGRWTITVKFEPMEADRV